MTTRGLRRDTLSPGGLGWTTRSYAEQAHGCAGLFELYAREVLCVEEGSRPPPPAVARKQARRALSHLTRLLSLRSPVQVEQREIDDLIASLERRYSIARLWEITTQEKQP